MSRHLGGYTLDASDDDIDAVRFDRMLVEGRRHLRRDPGQASMVLSEALGLWRGPALAGLEGDFFRSAASRLEQRRIDALEARLEADLALDRHGDVLGELSELVERYPTRERLWAHLMVALYRCGRQADALAAYRRVAGILREELGLFPGTELRGLEQAILEQHPSLDAPSAVRSRPRLPLPLGPFIGRDDESDVLRSLIDENRLITLVGTAGIGKTRLAVEVVRTLGDRFSAGVWFVDLAPLTTIDLVAQKAADVLGIYREPGLPLVETLSVAMAGRHALVILDNCEHLVEACAELAAALVAAGSDIRVLATSREPLGLPGEVIFPVMPLRLPSAGEAWERVAASESVCLFAARAAAALPGFRVTRDNVQSVWNICRRLDGLPLAIELAAARVGTLPVGDIAHEVGFRTALLDSGGETRGRRRGLRAAIEWSYQLLPEPAMLLFERLSVFAGGFTLEAAKAVGAGGPVAEDDVAPLVSLLSSRSLLHSEDQQSPVGRYRMLQPLRLYARDRLEAHGEARIVSERHAHFYVACAQAIEPHLFEGRSGPWLDRLRTEGENLRAALEWLIELKGDPPRGARLVSSLWHMWDLSGARSEGLRWLYAALDVTDTSDAERRLPLLAAGVLLHLGLGDLDAASDQATEQLELARTAQAIRWEGDALMRLGAVAWARGDLEAATVHYHQAVSALDAGGDPWRGAIAQAHLARAYRDGTKLDEARATAERAAIRARQTGEDTAVGFALDVLASILAMTGSPASAVDVVTEALQRYRDVGYREGEASALHLTGRLLLAEGALESARASFSEALEICRSMGHRAGIATNLEGLALVSLRSGQDRRAATLIGAATAQRHAVGVKMPEPERPAWNDEMTSLAQRLGQTELHRTTQLGVEQALDELLADDAVTRYREP